METFLDVLWRAASDGGGGGGDDDATLISCDAMLCCGTRFADGRPAASCRADNPEACRRERACNRRVAVMVSVCSR